MIPPPHCPANGGVANNKRQKDRLRVGHVVLRRLAFGKPSEVVG